MQMPVEVIRRRITGSSSGCEQQVSIVPVGVVGIRCVKQEVASA